MSSKNEKKNYLVREEIYIPTKEESLILGLMGYAAYKLWNVANYERRNWKELGLEEYPDWYDQTKRLKTNFFYKNLPSQSAQRTLKKLDESWESYYSLKKSGGVESPNPPRFKRDKMYVVFVQNAIQVLGDGTFRFTIPKQLKAHLREEHNLEVQFLYLKIGRLSGLRGIKEVQVSFREDGKLKLSIVYEVDLPKEKPDNGRYLSIDLGIKNNFTCYDSANVSSFILSGWLAKTHWFDKEIARFQSISAGQQAAQGVQYPKPSKKVLRLYERRRAVQKDFLHKSARFLVDYCVENNLHTIILGDWTKIRENPDGTPKDWGRKGNAKLHAFPFKKLLKILTYKCALVGIRLLVRSEAYTSQCPPDSIGFSKEFSEKQNRKHRGLFVHDCVQYNADSVGAFNILRKFLLDETNKTKLPIEDELFALRSPSRKLVA